MSGFLAAGFAICALPAGEGKVTRKTSLVSLLPQAPQALR